MQRVWSPSHSTPRPEERRRRISKDVPAGGAVWRVLDRPSTRRPRRRLRTTSKRGQSALVVARDRAVVGRLAVGEIEHHFVDVAPSPAFGRIVAFDDRMAGGVKMLGCVPVRRLVATSDMSACAAEPQMEPDVAGLETFFAAERTRRYVANGAQMGAGL